MVFKSKDQLLRQVPTSILAVKTRINGFQNVNSFVED